MAPLSPAKSGKTLISTRAMRRQGLSVSNLLPALRAELGNLKQVKRVVEVLRIYYCTYVSTTHRRVPQQPIKNLKGRRDEDHES